MTLDGKSIARCMKPKNFRNFTSCTLHHFFYACETGYGQPSYVRLVNDIGQVHCSLLVGKSRIKLSKIQEAQEKIILMTQAENIPNGIRYLKLEKRTFPSNSMIS